jgi:hypothetical protein
MWAVSSVIGFCAVAGVGAVIYTSAQTNTPTPSPYVTSSYEASPTYTYAAPTYGDTSVVVATTAYVDPVCATVIPALGTEIQQASDDDDSLDTVNNSYNAAVEECNSGATPDAPSFAPVASAADTVASDLKTMESTLETAIDQAQDSAVVSALDAFSSANQDMISLYESYADQSVTRIEPASDVSQMYTAADNLDTACGD